MLMDRKPAAENGFLTACIPSSLSFTHFFSAFCGSHAPNTPSPVSSAGSNNSLENTVYLVKVPKSHVVAGCENAQGAEDAVVIFRDAKMTKLRPPTENH